MNESNPGKLLGLRGPGLVGQLREKLKDAKMEVEKWRKSYWELEKKHMEVCDELEQKVSQLTAKEEALKYMTLINVN